MVKTVIPAGYRYTREHEWVNMDQGKATVGVTDYAQHELGDITYVELPEVGHHVHQGEEVAVVESVKAASEIYAPVSGEVVEVNTALPEAPEEINSDPYNDGWIFRIKPDDPIEIEDLFSAEEYREMIGQEE